MDADVLQSVYYALGIVAVVCAGFLWIARATIGKLTTRITALEREAVTVTAFRDALQEMLDRFEERLDDYMGRMDERFSHLNEKHADMKTDLRAIQAGQQDIKDEIAALPCPGPRLNCGG